MYIYSKATRGHLNSAIEKYKNNFTTLKLCLPQARRVINCKYKFWHTWRHFSDKNMFAFELQVFLVRKNQGKDAGNLYAMKVLRKATLKGLLRFLKNKTNNCQSKQCFKVTQFQSSYIKLFQIFKVSKQSQFIHWKIQAYLAFLGNFWTFL